MKRVGGFGALHSASAASARQVRTADTRRTKDAGAQQPLRPLPCCSFNPDAGCLKLLAIVCTLANVTPRFSPWAQQSVRWVLGFFAQLYANSDVKIAPLVEPLRLEALMRARIVSLSKGERKRVLLALGLLTPQPLLMLDEPFDGLDLRQTRDVMTLVRSETGTGRTLMLSIHQLVDAGRVCDRLVLLSDGRAVGEGTLPELKAQANLSEGSL